MADSTELLNQIHEDLEEVKAQLETVLAVREDLTHIKGFVDAAHEMAHKLAQHPMIRQML